MSLKTSSYDTYVNKCLIFYPAANTNNPTNLRSHVAFAITNLINDTHAFLRLTAISRQCYKLSWNNSRMAHISFEFKIHFLINLLKYIAIAKKSLHGIYTCILYQLLSKYLPHIFLVFCLL